MNRRSTIYDYRYKTPPGAEALIALWNEDLTGILLNVVWNAYDEIHKDYLSEIPWNDDYDDLERSISQELELAIHRNIDGFMPCQVQHGPFERASRAKPPAQPPQYDIAFVWSGDHRVMWPLEAKVLKSDQNTVENLGDYIKTVNERYLTCYYAPFSNGGAMLGYLKSGDPEKAIEHIGVRLGNALLPYAPFAARCHRISDHERSVPTGADYPISFRCHHLILPLYGV